MGGGYDRYKFFRSGGFVPGRVPFAEIPESGSDLRVVYDRGRDRMDLMAYRYYGDPDLGWLILQGNPSVGGFEFEIPNGAVLRIPYPKDDALRRYEEACEALGKEDR